jgi:hypothetical protein
MKLRDQFGCWLGVIGLLVTTGCTVKAVGDPNRPITINAHITIDVKGLQKTASSIEDYVSGADSTPQSNSNSQGGK